MDGFHHPVISKSSSSFNIHWVTVPRAPITIGITVTFMFHSFFNSLARSRYLSLFSFSFNFVLCSAETAKSTMLQVLVFFLDNCKVRRLGQIRWSVYMSKFHRNLCVSFSRTDAALCIYHLFVWSYYYHHYYHQIEATWTHMNVCKLFVLKLFTWRYNSLQMISIR